MLWFACHFVFNLEYCKGIKNVAFFCCFGLPERSTTVYLTYLKINIHNIKCQVMFRLLTV